MIDDELPFLRAAAADPGDDTLRLAYADWLQERDGVALAAHAEFVRLQVRRSRLDVFDPGRTSLLEEEAACLRQYKRDWNGRVHQRFHRKGLRGLVDSRRGAIRGWDYHRGMISRVCVSAEGLLAHPELVFSLGPVESLRVVGWPAGGWGRSARALGPLLPRVKVLSLAGTRTNTPLPDLTRLGGIELVPLLDLRSLWCGTRADQLLALARSGSIPPVVLFRRTLQTPRPYAAGGNQYVEVDSREADHVIDPFGHWGGLRLWFADLAGEVVSPVPYHGTSR